MVEAKLELEAAGIDVTGVSPLLELEYRMAYRQGIEWEMMTNKGGTKEDWERNARDAALSTLHGAFLRGEVVTSTDGITYAEVYGNDWDKLTLSEVGVVGNLRVASHGDDWFVI